jgi:hypothetical protein
LSINHGRLRFPIIIFLIKLLHFYVVAKKHVTIENDERKEEEKKKKKNIFGLRSFVVDGPLDRFLSPKYLKYLSSSLFLCDRIGAEPKKIISKQTDLSISASK